ncbi:nucleoside diphosphate-linked moiety X motif 8-like isoform X2 [Rhagoletis pomonella]|uniref:nucleoside diphosphate-linked moiety X motif 8-like isoform X1 n=2 Tax=Rhagoletis pomonella TaxID=28610 RepID=UPI0017805C26|nr:nucleoside diphosphate-linked moiety X motif 8-like isoform X1 [Rhagoletis pomonella]XP_036341526.1 nucleoside diphosphate-linked moiety X motif 8-like isoform X1 [Rhagoletis pomonella]XP_036342874.1 nucleoside diphosphate-linked moiety X motif 8-like isoform X2 [Rhagoletis pomonella]XP_036343015.1 nucleoside diphosphate-linked moiety X motif 8-like isoform X2 [Rhagoletis pomonella]
MLVGKCFPFQIIQRSITLLTANHIRVHNHNNEEGKNVDELLRPDILLSEENKLRSIQCMEKSTPVGLRSSKTTREKTFAAVLICLCTNERKEISILYTRRSGRLSRHVRQISFPGGIKDPEDADFIDCALRETEEEIGLPRRRINVWGTGNLISPPNTAAIMPVVGTVENFTLKELKLNEDEVEEALVIPIKELVHPKTIKHTQFKSGWSTPNFVVGQNKVWGITGFITNTFLQCLIPTDLKRLKHHVKYIRPFKIKH